MRGFALGVATFAALLGGCDLVFQVDTPDERIDEDFDGIPNVRDNCPGIANDGQDDTGEDVALEVPDGVGDSCDPKVDTAGDAIVATYFFTDPPNDPAGWQVMGPWQFEDNYVEVDARNTVAILTSPPLAKVFQRTTMEAGFEVIDLATGFFSACTDFSTRCVEVRHGAPPELTVINELDEVDGSDPITVKLPDRVVLQLRREVATASDPTDLKGFIRNLNDIDKSGDAQTGTDTTSVFVVVDHAWVRLHHVVIYGVR
jgi:hypothetical protein